ncbi:MAG TPA: hypothetical protein VJR89_09185, partial [Polyangiales bacterium]|nr:hypothetical protein [Polyangiales bacterium]
RANAHFGYYIALDGDLLAISAPEDSGGGAIHTFEWDGTGFRSIGELRGDSDELLLGRSIALEGNRLAAGAPGDNRGATGAGSVWVWERRDGRWQDPVTLRPKGASTWDFLGSAVALEGDLIASGATGRTVEGTLPGGAVYVFQRTADGWKELQMLRPTVNEPGAFFGESVGISGDSIAVGAFNGNGGLTGGAAYVFQRAGDGTWSQQALLRPTNTRSGDFFALRLAISGDTLLVGAPREASANGGIAANGGGTLTASGAVYVFSRERGNWRQLVQIKPEQPMASAEFGIIVDIQGDEFVVGTTDDFGRDGSGAGTGSVYVFR